MFLEMHLHFASLGLVGIFFTAGKKGEREKKLRKKQV